MSVCVCARACVCVCVCGWGITSQANPSSVTTERFLQPRRLDPSSLGASHHRHIQLQRHCGVSSGSDTPRVQDTNTANATHSEQTNNTATHRAADMRSGSSTCKQSQQPTLVDQSGDPSSDLWPPPLT